MSLPPGEPTFNLMPPLPAAGPVIAARAARAGRPRSAQAEAAILAAAIELLLEHGFEAMSIGQLAARAGVGKATIYRRWSSKLEVVIAALAQLSPPPPAVDTGSTVGDLLELISRRVADMTRTGRHLLIPRLTAELRNNPELRDPLVEKVVAPGLAPVRAIFERGIERGELRADLDPDLAVDLVAGPFIYRLVRGAELDQILDDAPSVIAAVMKGIGR